MSKGFIIDYAKHLPYEQDARLYIVKYLCDRELLV
jgi:hypothetical protein